MKTFEIDLTRIQSVIEQMIDDSEMVYGFISDQLPELENQAETAITESKKLLKKFENTDQSDQDTFIHLINNLDNKMENIYEDLINQKDISKLLNEITSANEDQVTFDTLLNLIDDLTEVFSSLEQLSINAIIFSSRLEQGDAFRVISKKINQLSKKVKKEYNIFEKNIKILKKWNEDFISQLENLNKTQKDIFDQYNQSLIKAIEEIIESLEGISMLIDDFIGQVEKSLEPIENIIVELQSQDLIRQNMENLNEIIFTLSESIEKFNSKDLDKEESLNTVQFIIDIGELSKNLLNNIDEQFSNSINSILEHALEMDKILEIINDDGKALWDYMVNGIKKGENISSSIDRKNKLVLDEITLFENKINNIIEGYKELDECDDTLDEYLSKIKNDFDDISKMASRFDRVKLLAKIEFARLNRNDDAHIKNIEKIIDVFIDFTKENQDIFKNIEKTLVKDIKEFSNIRENIKKKLAIASKTINYSKIELDTVKKAVKDTISKLIDITTSLYKDIHYIINELESFNDMSGSINEMNEILDELVKQAKTIKESLVNEYEIDQWKSTNDYYESIEEKFTSYIERKTASESFVSDDLDTGSEGGELTLF